MSAIKFDLSEKLRWREAVPQCAEYLEKHKDKGFQEQAEICILNLLQVLGGHIVEEEIGQPVLAMGDGLYMPSDEAQRLGDMASDYERASGMEAPSGGETVQQGSTEGDSPTAAGGDAQGPSQ